jgi:NTE family protein
MHREIIESRVDALPRPMAFVLSGGVAHGAIQVGMLLAAYEQGIRPDFFVGSSAGAINAAYAGVEFTEKRLRRLAEIWSGLKRSDVFGQFDFRRIVNILTERAALASPEALMQLLSLHIPESADHHMVPTHVTATDYLSGETVTLSRGNLWDNLLASCAIPFIFPPVPMDDRYLIDGSVSAHVPLLPAHKLGAKTFVVFDVGYPCGLDSPPQNQFEKALHILGIMLHRQPTGVLSALPKDVTVLYLPSPCPLAVATYEFSRGAWLIQAGYRETLGFFSRLRLSGPGVYGHPHSHADGSCVASFLDQ